MPIESQLQHHRAGRDQALADAKATRCPRTAYEHNTTANRHEKAAKDLVKARDHSQLAREFLTTALEELQKAAESRDLGREVGRELSLAITHAEDALIRCGRALG